MEEEATYATEEHLYETDDESEDTNHLATKKSVHDNNRRDNTERRPELHSGTDARGLGIDAPMKTFIVKPMFSGAYDEDLDNVLSIFDTLLEM